MPKLTRKQRSQYVVGDYWLERREESPFWQITSYNPKTRSCSHRSTACERLEDAKPALDAFYAEKLAKAEQRPDEATVIPLLLAYWKEKGHLCVNADQTKMSLRTFAAFLVQDEIGPGAVVSDLLPGLMERFRKWRMAPHSFTLRWGETTKPYESGPNGVKGSTVQRNINDVRAAVNYALDNMRIPQAPKIKDIDRRHRSKHKDRVLTEDELARIVWYSFHFPDLFRFVALQMMTSVRPMAAGQFDPGLQYDRRSHLIDLQPDEAPQTKKRNAIIPAVRPLRPIFEAWERQGVEKVTSHRSAWRTMRDVLGLSDDVQAKTIRYTIATWLYEMDWVPERQISEMLGHTSQIELARTSRIYAQYRPEKMGKVVRGLEQIWLAVSRRARDYSAGHLLVTRRGVRGGSTTIELKNRLKLVA